MRKRSKLLSLLTASALVVSSLSVPSASVKADQADAVVAAIAEVNTEETVKRDSKVLGKDELNWEDSGRVATKDLTTISGLSLPSVYSVTVNLEMYCDKDNKLQNLVLVSDGGNLAGIQYLKGKKTITAWTGWTGNRDLNQSSDEGKFQNGGVILEGYEDNTKITVNFVIDQTSGYVIASCNDGAPVALPFAMSAKTLKSLKRGQYQTSEKMTVYDVTVEEPDEDFTAVIGQTAMAKVAGVTVTKDYSLIQANVAADEKFEWKVTKKGETQAAAGVSIADGKLSVTEEAAPGDYTITAASMSNNKKSAALNVKIDDYQEMTLTVSGPHAFHLGDSGVYKIVSAVNKYGDGLPESLLTGAVWSTDKVDVISIGSATGEAQAVGTGEATLKVELTNGTATSKKEIKVAVSNYYLIKDVENGSVTITDEEKGKLIKTQNVVAYQLTATNADGKVVTSTEAAEIPDTFAAAGATKVEVAPIFEYTIKAPGTLGESAGYEIVIPDGSYNFKVTDQTDEKNHQRYDIYINDQMLVNNFLQNATVMNSTIEVQDFVVKNGAAVTSAEYSSGKNGSVVNMTMRVVKSPTNATRVQKVYVLGDSLVANYYDGGAPYDPGIEGDDRDCYRTGWGQVLPLYMKNVDIINLGNSGITAVGLLDTAFTQVQQSAKPGDIMLLESGYNDETYDTEEIMKTSVQAMVDQALALGVKVILVSPNASVHDYRESVKWAGYMADVANANKDKVQYIDLSKLSFDFLVSLYGVDKDSNGNTIAPQAIATELVATYNLPTQYAFQEKDDTLHASYRGANKWASIVADALFNLGYTDIINTKYVYEFTDKTPAQNVVTCRAGKETVFEIKYNLNGGKKHTNPTTYKSDDATITLKAPTGKKNYTFAGWYTEKTFENKITKINPSKEQNYELYAKWTKVSVAKPVLKSVTNSKGKKMVVKLNKKLSGVDGYEVEYTVDSKFKKSVKTVAMKKTATSVTIKKNLKKNKTYYVRVRAYKNDSTGAKVYGKYSSKKKVTIKK